MKYNIYKCYLLGTSVRAVGQFQGFFDWGLKIFSDIKRSVTIDIKTTDVSVTIPILSIQSHLVGFVY